MFEKTLLLSNFKSVKNFVELCNGKEYKIDLVSGKTTVDAKSIIGVFSLDLTKPVVMVAHTDQPADLALHLKPYEYK